MTYVREPVLQPVPIESLRPTQITVGMREVEEKRKRLRKEKPHKIGEFIGHHMIPVVLGPKSATTSRKLDSAILVMKAAKDRL